ncbi:Cleavage and polyadenylation specificity factor subunit 1, partial [Cichlidogyrus casuarinus]
MITIGQRLSTSNTSADTPYSKAPQIVPQDALNPIKIIAQYEQITKPTSISFSFYCNIVSADEKHLLTIRANVLEVFHITKDNKDDSQCKFSTLFSELLPSQVYDASIAKMMDFKLDCLLLSFKDAKVALLTYDPSQMEFRTLSLHNYEFDQHKNGCLNFVHGPMMRVDPLSRCAVVLVYDRHLAVLPFKRPEALNLDELQEQAVTASAYNCPVLPSFTIALENSTSEKILHVRDMKFMPGFFEPTLAILYEPTATWAGRLVQRKDTCCLLALSFNLHKRTNPVIWFHESLPYDAYKVVPVSSRYGGALVIATNSILYLKQNNPSVGLPLNYFAKISTNFPMKMEVPICGPLSLDGVSILELSDEDFLLVTFNGESYILTLWLDTTSKSVQSLVMNGSKALVPASCMSMMENRQVFIGSEQTDSILVRYETGTTQMDKEGNYESWPEFIPQKAEDEEKEEEEVKKNGEVAETEVEPEQMETSVTESDIDSKFNEADYELYGNLVKIDVSKFKPITTYTFEVQDHLLNLGPMSSLTCGEIPFLTHGTDRHQLEEVLLNHGQPNLAIAEAIACVYRDPSPVSASNPNARLSIPGCGEIGGPGIAFIQRTVHAKCSTTFELPGHCSVWSLYGPPMRDSDSVSEISEEPDWGDEEEPTVQQAEEPSANHDNEQPLEEEEKQEPVPEPKPKKPFVPLEERLSRDKLPKPVGQQHSFLLLSGDDSTMILEVGKEIVELGLSGYNTAEATLAAFNIGAGYCTDDEAPASPKVGHHYPYIMQVSPNSVRLLDGSILLECVQLTREYCFFLAAHCDPYVLLASEDDELFFLRLKTKEEIAKHMGGVETEQSEVPVSKYFEITKPKVGQVAAPSCFTLCQDTSGNLCKWIFSQTSAMNRLKQAHNSGLLEERRTSFLDQSDCELPNKPKLSQSDQEDMSIYGYVLGKPREEKEMETCMEEEEEKPVSVEPAAEVMNVDEEEEDVQEQSGRYFAFVVFTNGVLEIYSLPSFTLLVEVHHFAEFPSFLIDHRAAELLKKAGPKNTQMPAFGNQPEPVQQSEDDLVAPVLELKFMLHGLNHDRPLLFARNELQVVAYEAQCYSGCAGDEFGLLRWRKLPEVGILVPPKRVRSHPKCASLQARFSTSQALMTTFEDIGGHRGVFVAGTQPTWMFLGRQGHLRVVAHALDGVLSSMAPLNTVSCPAGFVCLTQANEMRLATLPSGYDWTAEVGVKWISLDSNPHYVQYHLESRVYALVTSKPQIAPTVFKLNTEGAKVEEFMERPRTCVYPEKDNYYLQLCSSERCIYRKEGPFWETVPYTTFEFDQWEVVNDLKTVALKVAQSAQGTRDLLAVCANLSYGEEIPVRGRIVIFDIVEVVPQPGRPLTSHKMKKLCDQEQQGSVTCLSSCSGHLLGAVGQK